MAVAAGRIEVAVDYADHAASVTRYLISLTRDPGVAEDLAQEAFVRLIGEVDSGRRPTNVRGWLFRVASNLAASRGRHLAVVARHAAGPAPDRLGALLEDEVVGRERTAAINEALARLRDDDREIILLAASGLDGLELAERFGKSPIATRTMLCRARARLREELAVAGFGR
jgi:RNA polymerase sigma-70 factor (ECF subfamily)